jgi:hypothetical protein
MLTITDNYSRKSWIYLSKTRDTVYDSLIKWRKQVELETDLRLKAIRIDNAKELKKIGELLAVIIENTTPYTPEQNGVAERLNRTLITKARSMLAAARLPKEFWGEAVHTACYLKNLIPQNSKTKSPEEIWTGKKPSGKHLRVFGCIAYPTVPKEQQTDKLDNTAIRGVFVGYERSTKHYRIYNPISRSIRLYTSVKFDENTMGGSLLQGEQTTHSSIAETPEAVFDLEEEEISPRNNRINDINDQNNDISDQNTDINDSNDEIGSNIDVRTREDNSTEAEQLEERYPTTRSGRVIRLPARYDNNRLALSIRYDSSSEEVPTPSTYIEAISSKYQRQWSIAIKEQLNSLAANNTWTEVDKPKGINLVTPKWVFKVKRLPNGQIDKYKARLVARGFTQQYGIDYLETLSPVVRLESLRIIFAIAAAKRLVLHQMDVVSAYLIGELQDEVYLEPPEGLKTGKNRCLKLNKGIPGLKQSGRVWNKTIVSFFNSLGLYALLVEPSVFTNSKRDIIVALYVDDLILAGPSVRDILPIKNGLKQQFHMKDLGEAKYILGIRIQKDQDGSITIDQSHYIRDMVKQAGIIGDKEFRLSTPSNGYENLRKALSDKPEPLADIREYQRLVGKANWLVRATRPDIAFVTQRLSQYTHNPTIRHLGGVTYLLKYLSNTRDYQIRYAGGTEDLKLLGYSDTDYAADDATRKSTNGYIFILNGGAISWSSKLQRSVTTSTTEAEYTGLSYSSKEAIWIRSFLEQLGYKQLEPTTIYGDNQSAIALVKNPEFHVRTKHIDIAIHYVRELVEDNLIDIQYISTKEMLADILTKPLPKQRHTEIVRKIKLRLPNLPEG